MLTIGRTLKVVWHNQALKLTVASWVQNSWLMVG
jgi:hypothetical protein